MTSRGLALAPLDRRAVRAWCFYDWANSAFATTIMAAMYPPFFRSLAVAAGMSPSRATAVWGYTASLALLITAVLAPILGAIADHSGRRKRFLALFLGIGVSATAGFVLNGDDTWILAAALFVLGSVGFAGGNVFYEALLPGVARGGDMDRISAAGYAIGYLGGGLLLVINAAWVMKPTLFGMADAATAVRASFLSVAVWWALFSFPLFRHVAEPPAVRRPNAHRLALVEGFQRLRATFSEIRRFHHALVFLIAFWIYNDGISTIIKMAAAYGDEIGIGLTDLIAALVLTQFIGIPFAFLFGRLARPFGVKRAVLLALAVYTAVSILGFFMHTAAHFYILACLVGTVQGGSQALSRSLYATMIPVHKVAEFFAFFSVSGKLAGIIGPLVFGVVAELTGTSRLSIVSLVFFFVLGGYMLSKVDVEAGVAAARQAETEVLTAVE